MASFWFYLLLSIGFLIGGAVIFGLSYSLWGMFKDFIFKKRIPKDKEERKKKFLDGGDSNISQKEVEENERDQISRFREFEKLRKHIRERYSEPLRKPVENSARDEQFEGRGILPPLPNFSSSRDFTRTKEPKRAVKLD